MVSRQGMRIGFYAGAGFLSWVLAVFMNALYSDTSEGIIALFTGIFSEPILVIPFWVIVMLVFETVIFK